MDRRAFITVSGGWVDGQNISIVRRYTERRDDRLPDLAAELAVSLARPGGNVTGITLMGSATAGKELQLLRDCAPSSRVVYIWDLTNPGQTLQQQEADAAALALGIRGWHIGVRTNSELDDAMPLLLKKRTEAVVVYGLPVSEIAMQRFSEFAVKNRLLTVTAVPDLIARAC